MIAADGNRINTSEWNRLADGRTDRQTDGERVARRDATAGALAKQLPTVDEIGSCTLHSSAEAAAAAA